MFRWIWNIFTHSDAEEAHPAPTPSVQPDTSSHSGAMTQVQLTSIVNNVTHQRVNEFFEPPRSLLYRTPSTIGSVIGVGAVAVAAGALVAMQMAGSQGALLGPPGVQGVLGVLGPQGLQGQKFTIQKKLSPKDWSPRTGKCICTHGEEA